jgi:putative ABC transport system permease protein
MGGTWLFEFTEGDWETAMPILDSGCGVLVTPMIAGNNGVELGETFEVTGVDGPVECTVAGIGSPLVGASIVGIAAGDEFGISDPISAGAWPVMGADQEEFDAVIVEIVWRLEGVEATYIETLMTLQVEVMEMLPHMFNALLLLAALAGALGVVNTTIMSVTERRREMGLLRAVGATRRQVTTVVVGEAALMGLLSGVLGLVAGSGVIVVIAVVYGGNGWGVTDLDLWPAAWRAVQTALPVGLVGVLIAPLISAAAAWPPARAALRGGVVDMLQHDR